ncbi:MAG: hypothetical protein UT30_C0008G0045 [Candidatus Uhrbacteria bacterium GW2011_GWF2_39_13]|uniref:General secretion pathway protein G n=1 Tax=Candidatus Uhrbacteria bacterium GW2011_GWF2_39_13 TaxID=1618995 RepID=A0A0G0MMT1_9BACT|nr:MAG: hypothetical protein UT30_C0008G0045 [Candidatus Uhrbacteria bacterium GW2011_GWF2_39_13]
MSIKGEKIICPLRKKLYFTLLELLIVISIIAILASLLLPGLKAAKDRARMIQCSGNLRNIGTCLTSYIGDNNDWCPVGWMEASQGGCGAWTSQNGLIGYALNNPKYADYATSSYYRYLKGTIFDCPGIKLLPIESDYLANPTEKEYNPYGWNSYGWGTTGMGYKCNPVANQLYHVRSLSVSPDTIALSDIRKRLNTSGLSTFCEPRRNWYEADTVPTFGPRHINKGNALFFDCHVEAKKTSDIAGLDTESVLSKRKYWTHNKD